MQQLLILTRKKEEAILIGKDIVVKVLDIEGDRVRLGIEAPRELKVLREELYNEVSNENIKALESTKKDIDDVFKIL